MYSSTINGVCSLYQCLQRSDLTKILLKQPDTSKQLISFFFFSLFSITPLRIGGYNPSDTGARRLIKRHILCYTMRNYQIGLQQPTKLAVT